MPVRELLTFWKKNCDWGRYNMGKYFGTDGFRGEARITLTADHAYKVGRFLGWYYNALRERNGDTDPARKPSAFSHSYLHTLKGLGGSISNALRSSSKSSQIGTCFL